MEEEKAAINYPDHFTFQCNSCDSRDVEVRIMEDDGTYYTRIFCHNCQNSEEAY